MTHNHDAPKEGNIMLVRYFRRPSRIERLRSSTGGHLLEGFAEELSQGRYQGYGQAHRLAKATTIMRSAGVLP